MITKKLQMRNKTDEQILQSDPSKILKDIMEGMIDSTVMAKLKAWNEDEGEWPMEEYNPGRATLQDFVTAI